MNPPYDIIYADPPWSYRGREQFGFAGDVGVSTGGAVRQYETIPIDVLCTLPVAQIAAPDCLLYLWCTGPLLLTDCPTLIRAWGFEYATVAFTWYKGKANPGYYTLSSCEFCVVAKRGRIPQPRGVRNARQWIEGETICEERTVHSRKPAEARNRIMAMHPTQRKIELFARERVEGWDGWGNEYPDAA